MLFHILKSLVFELGNSHFHHIHLIVTQFRTFFKRRNRPNQYFFIVLRLLRENLICVEFRDIFSYELINWRMARSYESPQPVLNRGVTRCMQKTRKPLQTAIAYFLGLWKRQTLSIFKIKSVFIWPFSFFNKIFDPLWIKHKLSILIFLRSYTIILGKKFSWPIIFRSFAIRLSPVWHWGCLRCSCSLRSSSFSRNMDPVGEKIQSPRILIP